MEKNDPTDEELEAQRKTKFKVNPKISIVIPLYNTPVDLFRELIFNLYRQTYQNWELCLADGSKEELTEIKNMCKDSRIKYKFLGKNLGISGNSNEGLKMATGDWVALLDHDDLLMVNALYEVVKVINENKNVRFIYTDEDKMKTIDEPRFDAHFKPDFAPDYLRGNNYICHLSVFKKEVMDKLEGFRDDYNGAQDLDIILRTTEIVAPNEIVHIPKVLYHWRIIETSTAGNPETKLYAYESGRKAIEDHIHRLGYSGKVERDPNMYGIYRALYDIEGHPKANIIISEYNNKENLERCIKTIEDITEYKNYDINILVNSDDETAKEYLQKIEKKNNIYVHRNIDKDLSIFEKLNIVSERVKGDYLVFVNGNLEIKEPRWLTDFIGFTQRNNVGSISGRIFTKDDILYFGGRAVNYAGVIELNRGLNRKYYGYFAKECHIENYTANFYKYMCIRKEIFNKVGKFDIKYKQVSDVDLSLKLLDLNMNNVYMPYDYAISYDDAIAFDEDGIEIGNPDLGDRIKEELEIVEKRGIKYDKYYTKNFNQGSNKYAIRVDKIEE